MPKTKILPPRKLHLDRRARQLAVVGEGDNDDLLSTKEIAEWLAVSIAWLEIGRLRGYGPPFVRLSPGQIRYRRGAVREWLAEREHLHTAEYRARPGKGRKPAQVAS
jgi:predicted DNA-binding transcriptional regulator AlpA